MPMSRPQYYQRMFAYIIAAMLTQYIGDASTLKEADFIDITIVMAKVILAGTIVWRAFLDKSVAEVENVKSKID